MYLFQVCNSSYLRRTSFMFSALFSIYLSTRLQLPSMRNCMIAVDFLNNCSHHFPTYITLSPNKMEPMCFSHFCTFYWTAFEAIYLNNLQQAYISTKILKLILSERLFIILMQFCRLKCDDTDVNECTTNNGGCSAVAICTNTVGSFTCTCHSGYTGDGFTCTGRSTWACLLLCWVLFSSNWPTSSHSHLHYIRIFFIRYLV